MINRILSTACLAVVAWVLVASVAQARNVQLTDSVPAVGEGVAALQMYWAERDIEEVAERAAALAGLMADEPLHADEAAEVLATAESTDWVIPFHEAPQLRVRHIAEYDELRIMDEDVMADDNPASDVGKAGALERVSDYLTRLDAAGLIEASQYDLADAQIGYRQVGGGKKDGTQAFERIVEYRVTLRRELNGIQMANAGLRFAVHASGKLAGVRFGGVTVDSARLDGIDQPLGKGGVRARTVSDEEALQRFQDSINEKGNASIAYSRLMYVMPEDTRAAVVEPSYVVSYSERHLSVEGQEVISRRQTVGYSITDADAPVLEYSAPAKKAPAASEPVRLN